MKKLSRSQPVSSLHIQLPHALHRVLREMAASRGKPMRKVLIEGWLRHDREALDRYTELKRMESKRRQAEGGE